MVFFLKKAKQSVISSKVLDSKIADNVDLSRAN